MKRRQPWINRALTLVQWMMGDNGRTFFSGSIGKDDFGNMLLKKVEEAGIDAIFYTTEDEPTGTCASLINGRGYRSLVTNLAAAKSFKTDHLERGKTIVSTRQHDISLPRRRSLTCICRRRMVRSERRIHILLLWVFLDDIRWRWYNGHGGRICQCKHHILHQFHETIYIARWRRSICVF